MEDEGDIMNDKDKKALNSMLARILDPRIRSHAYTRAQTAMIAKAIECEEAGYTEEQMTKAAVTEGLRVLDIIRITNKYA